MDYQFRLVERGGGNISLMEYKDWRKQGNAYMFQDDSEGDIAATQPNMTLVSSVKCIGKDNEKHQKAARKYDKGSDQVAIKVVESKIIQRHPSPTSWLLQNDNACRL